jgi:hypothetical protein
MMKGFIQTLPQHQVVCARRNQDTIDCQEQLEQGRQFFDVLCLEYQGKEVLSGKDKQGAFEAILDNLTDQSPLAGFGAFAFIAQVTQQRQIARIEGISGRTVDLPSFI